LSPQLFLDHDELHLSVLADLQDGKGLKKLGPEQRITSSAYSYSAQLSKLSLEAITARSMPDGSITRQMLAPDVIAGLSNPGTPQILPGTITLEMLSEDLKNIISGINENNSTTTTPENNSTTITLPENNSSAIVSDSVQLLQGESSFVFADWQLEKIANTIPVEMNYYNDTVYQSLKSQINTWSNPRDVSESTSVVSEKTVARFLDGWATINPTISKAVFTPKVTLKSVGTTAINHILYDTAKFQTFAGNGSSHNTQDFLDLDHYVKTNQNIKAVNWQDSPYINITNGFLHELGYTNIVDANGSAIGIQLVKGPAGLNGIKCETSNDIAGTTGLDLFTGVSSNSIWIEVEPEHILCWESVSGGPNNGYYFGYASRFSVLGKKIGDPVVNVDNNHTYKPVPNN
jgi:hypothetical protein